MKINKPIPIRRKAREWTLCLLYQWEIRGEDLANVELDFFRNQVSGLEEGLEPKEIQKIFKITIRTYHGVLSSLDKIDQVLIESSHNWKLQRMTIVDRNVMRIAIYEILFQEDIPTVVSINEAIEIAKLYGSEDSGRFVNGVLDKIGKETNIPQQVET